ncbi:g7588 [Coccomyxa elongata]
MVLGAEVAYIAAIAALYSVKPTATLWVFIVPYFLSTLLMMFGNWCQHMFVNPECPRSAYGMAHNCVASGDNSMTFNDGYHILHHLNSTTHWSELPARFMNLLQQHVATKALVIEGWGVIDVGLAIFAGDYNAVVDRMLLPYHKPTDPAERAAAISMLKERLKPVKMTQA